MSAEENADQSMEEILQSIKRIIADDDDADDESGSKQEMDNSNDSSVLELTDLVASDNEPEEADSARMDPLPPAAPAAAPAAASFAADDALVSDNVAKASADALSSLLSQPESKPIAPVKIDSPSFRSGATVEDMVMESLKPMLKQWLDDNLQTIVERIVEKEVKRISNQ